MEEHSPRIENTKEIKTPRARKMLTAQHLRRTGASYYQKIKSKIKNLFDVVTLGGMPVFIYCRYRNGTEQKTKGKTERQNRKAKPAKDRKRRIK